MNYIDEENAVGIKEQNRRNNIRKSSLFRLQGQKEKIEEIASKPMGLLKQYPHLKPYLEFFQKASSTFYRYCFESNEAESTVLQLGNNYKGKSYGFSRGTDATHYKDFLPGAKACWLQGDFNKWGKDHQLNQTDKGYFQIVIEDDQYGKQIIETRSRVGLLLQDEHGRELQILPPSARYLRREGAIKAIYSPSSFCWQSINPPSLGLKQANIYEIDLRQFSKQQFENLGEQLLKRLVNAGFNILLIRGVLLRGPDCPPLHRLQLDLDLVGLVDQFKMFVDAAHSLNLKVLFEFKLQEVVPDPFYDCFLNPARTSFNVANPAMVAILLASFASTMKEYNLDGLCLSGLEGILFTSGDKALLQADLGTQIEHSMVEGYAFLVTLRHLISKIEQSSVLIAEVQGTYPCLTVPIFEGGLGFDLVIGKAYALPEEQTPLAVEGLADRIPRDSEFKDRRKDALASFIRFSLSGKGFILSSGRACLESVQVEKLACCHKLLDLCGEELGAPLVLVNRAGVLAVTRGSVLFLINLSDKKRNLKLSLAESRCEMLCELEEGETGLQQGEGWVRACVGEGAAAVLGLSLREAELEEFGEQLLEI